MLFKKYTFVIIFISIMVMCSLGEFFVFHFLTSNLKEAEKGVPVEIRLPIINLAAYDLLYKKGGGEEKKIKIKSSHEEEEIIKTAN